MKTGTQTARGDRGGPVLCHLLLRCHGAGEDGPPVRPGKHDQDHVVGQQAAHCGTDGEAERGGAEGDRICWEGNV